MFRTTIVKGLTPTKIVPDKWWKSEPIKDPMALKKSDNDVLLIVGDATGAVDDMSAFIALGSPPFDTMAMNYSHRLIPWTVDHFVAGDSHKKDMQHEASILSNGAIKHCWNAGSKGFDVRWIRNGRGGWNGTTLTLGLKIGIELDYTKIVLAGCPMDNSGNWYADHIPSDDSKQGKDHRAHLWKWAEFASRPLARFIRSMSGNTKDLFGEVSTDWLNN